MTWAYEHPLRQEVRRGASSGVVECWPKNGLGENVSITGSATYAVYSPSNVTLASGTATKTAVSGVGDKLTVSVDASDTTAYALGEAYRVDVTYTENGSTRVASVYFDVVLRPFLSVVGPNDIVAEVVDAERRLGRQASAIGGSATAASVGALHGRLAWGDTMALIRAQTEGRGRIVPRLLVDQEAVRRVTVAFAVARMFRADGTAGGAESALLSAEWDSRARARFAELGELRYDATEDGAPDTRIGGWSTVMTRRTWGTR